jgi:glycosyltransferase involved in cell wall biosynthesis
MPERELSTSKTFETRSTMVAPFSIVCLSPSGWSVDLPTNRQQIMRRFAQRGHEILFVETDPFLGRLVSKAVRTRRWSEVRGIVSAVVVGQGVRTCKASNLLPGGHTYRIPNAINVFLTARRIRRLARCLPRPYVLWIYDPCMAGTVGSCGEAFAVYDCIDDYSALAFYGARERSLVARADERSARVAKVVATTTRALYERHSPRNPETYLVPNVGDFEHFNPASQPEFAAPELRDVRRPIIGFSGNLMRGKVDFPLLETLAKMRPDWTLLLVGPTAGRSVEEGLRRLTRLENVRWLGPKPYAEVPRYVAAFDVGLCPYVWNDWMRSGFPLKLYEYLAAGKPVVASGNPDLAGMEPDVVLARGAGEFVAAVEHALRLNGDQDRARRISLAARNTWDTRTQRLLDLVSAQLARSC